MLLSGSGHGDVEGAFDCREGGSGLILIDSGIAHPISVVAYRKCNGDRPGLPWFCSMCRHEKLLELGDCHGVRRDTAVAAWIKRWKHWGHRGAPECGMSLSETGMCYVRAIEGAIYDRELSVLIASLLVKDAHLEMHEDGVRASSSKQLGILRCPFDDLWFSRLDQHRQRDIGFEIR